VNTLPAIAPADFAASFSLSVALDGGVPDFSVSMALVSADVVRFSSKVSLLLELFSLATLIKPCFHSLED
jgi:hypothetical protein